MGFLDNYEASRERLERWNRTFPDGRIETRIVEFSAEKGYVLVEAKAFKNSEIVVAAGIDFAYGYQGAYQQNMKRWFVEDTVTSAIMRVQQLVMGGAERSTREIMEQVETTPTKIANADPTNFWSIEPNEKSGVASFEVSVEEIAKQLGGELLAEAPTCSHGHRVWRTGTSAKTGKPWGNYSCVERKPKQCDPYWYVLSSDGKWKPQL
jgi:hypothetical protein